MKGRIINGNLHFTEEEKHEIIQEYLSSGLSKRAIYEKYTGRKEDHGSINKWMRKLGYIDNKSQPYISFLDMPKKNKTSDPAQLEKRIQELEKALEEAQLKAMAYSTLIDVAEKELKIDIRKKSNTKQSKK